MLLKIFSTVCGTNLEYGFEDLKEHGDVDTWAKKSERMQQ